MGKSGRVEEGTGGLFPPPGEGRTLPLHAHTPIRRHGKVQATRSPYDGEWVSWRIRLGRHPPLRPRVARRLRKQPGRGRAWGLSYTEHETLAVEHIMPKAPGGSERDDHVPLWHRHGHARKTAQDRRGHGTCDTRHGAEEPDDAKASRPVLHPRRGGATPAEGATELIEFMR